MDYRIKKISILPDRSLMGKLGQTGYTIAQAIGELVDNSIDSRITNKLLKIQIDIDKKNGKIKIQDNGSGMNERAAAKSMAPGYSEKKNHLGEYGLGLKAASMNLGERFEVSTSPKGLAKEFILEFDKIEFEKNGSWNAFDMKIKDCDRDTHGTSVMIDRLNVNLFPQTPQVVRNELAIRVAPFIENKEIEITLNKKQCVPLPLQLQTDSFLPNGKEQFKLTLESGNIISGWRGLLKESGGSKGAYGFRLYHRNRLIVQHAKIGFNPHPETRLIIGELNLNHVPVATNKREFMEQSSLYRELVREGGIFWNFMKPFVEKARLSMKQGRVEKVDRGKIDQWISHLMNAVQTLPELEEFQDSQKKEGELINKNDEKGYEKGGDIEGIDPRDFIAPQPVFLQPVVKTPPEPLPVPPSPPSPPVPKPPVKARLKRSISIDGENFILDYDIEDFKNQTTFMEKDFIQESGILRVRTNVAFPAFSYKNFDFISQMHTAEAMAEFLGEKRSLPHDEIMKIKDKILMKAARTYQEDMDMIQAKYFGKNRAKKKKSALR